MYNLVLFDVDGTLIHNVADDSGCYEQAVKEELQLHALDTSWVNYSHVTDSGVLREVHRREFGTPTPPELEERVMFRCRDNWQQLADSTPERVQPIPGVQEFLTGLISDDRWSIGIITGAWKASVSIRLGLVDLPIDNIPFFTCDRHHTREGIVQTAIKEIGGNPEHIVLVGDGTWDVHCARALSMNFVGVGVKYRQLLELGATQAFADYVDGGSWLTAQHEATPPVSP
jgi:phosphoglycolate phosphatase-like HAD superfamily hydrolase